MSALVDTLCAPSSDAALIYDTLNAASAANFLFDVNAAAAFCVDGGVALGAAPVQQHAVSAPGAGAAVAVAVAAPGDVDATSSAPRRKRRRRARSCKSMEEAESQRMTHIAVERNRRRQMNEYLAVLRSLMPEAYVQRGDQASIVGGAIEFVKELEQHLQSLEAQKRTLVHQRQHYTAKPDTTATPFHSAAATPTTCAVAAVDSTTTTATSNCSSSVTEDTCSDAPPFARFFVRPQYVWCHHSPRESTMTMLPAEDGGGRPGVADIEVSLVEMHASVRVMAPRRPGQLLGMVTGLQALRLTVLHLTVTTLDALALYSLSLKVEEECGLTTVDDIAAAVHHVLCIIDADAATQQMLALGAVGH